MVFDEQFIQGQTPSAAVGQAWDNFLASLTETYTQVTISGSEDLTGVTCSDPVAVNQLAIALNSNAAVSVECNSRTWNTGSCGDSLELNSNPAGDATVCDCANPGYVVRPTIGSEHWGSVGGDTCNGVDQTLLVEFS